jgi:predicted GNAT family acetyltransferase
MIEYIKATQSDHNDLIDFLDYVWGSSYSPTNFERLLPGFFAEKNFMSGSNFMARENGKIVANVSSFPATHKVLDEQFKVCSISCVAVHNRARSKGYMKDLMEMAVNDQKESGTALSFLLGNRKRYEYFGYTPCGVRLNYTCTKTNIRHHLAGKPEPGIQLKEIKPGRGSSYDEVFQRYHGGKAYILRPRKRFNEVMGTWKNKTIGIYQDDSCIGYLSASEDYKSINDFNIEDAGLISDVVAAYLNQFNRHEVSVDVYPFETALSGKLSEFAESADISAAQCFNVLDYPAVLGAFLKLKCETSPMPDGSFTVGIQDVGNVTLSIKNNNPTVILSKREPDLVCTHLQAMKLFFSPVSAFCPELHSGFARAVLPIPLFVRKNDQS